MKRKRTFRTNWFGAFHGHLMALFSPEYYNPDWSDRNKKSILPIIPEKFLYKAEDRESVDKLLKKIQSGGYDFLINACDAGREGELIFWSFYEASNLQLPVKRFWASSTTNAAIKKALNNLHDSASYDGLRQAAKISRTVRLAGRYEFHTSGKHRNEILRTDWPRPESHVKADCGPRAGDKIVCFGRFF